MTILTPALVSAMLAGCGAEDPASDADPNSTATALGRGSQALSASTDTEVALTPGSVAFQLELDGQRFALSLERAPAPTGPSYQAFRRTRDGALIPLAPPEAGCTYRGVTEATDTANAPGFASMSVCRSATGRAAGEAASGIIRAGGRFWQLWPDPADIDASDGVDHFARPLRRSDALTPPEPVQRTTLARLPVSPVPRLEFREGTDAETKYLDLIMVNDAARVADLGGATETSTIQFVDTMNALLEGSGLSPRLRVTLRAQVLFDDDPYGLTVVNGNEVNHDDLLNSFLAWAAGEDLPVHDEHVLLSGLDFQGGVVGFAGIGVACTGNANGVIVQAGNASGGFAVLSAVHELGHTLGMDHDSNQPGCPANGDFIMAAVGCGNCPGAEEAQFSPCSIAQFQDFLEGPGYVGAFCADDVPLGTAPSCGDGAVQQGETCDCGSRDCADIDPCCNGATCQLIDGAECSDYNDGCCQGCSVVGADAPVVCRAQRSECDIAEVCTGTSKDCPADAFEPAGDDCRDDRGNDGLCYFGDCRSRGTQCEQIDAQQQDAAFTGIGEPDANCELPCDTVVCSFDDGGCLFIQGPTLNDGVRCDDGQCVDGVCVSNVDQCPADRNKLEPGDCGCGRPDTDTDADGSADCVDGCPSDGDKQAPGPCGCGQVEVDGDGDGAPDCVDECPSDATKQDAGDCGCGQPEIDSDRDGVSDCADECPDDSFFSRAGACGCGQPEVDTDFDGTADCVDECPGDASRTQPPCGSAAGSSFQRKSDDGCSLGSAAHAGSTSHGSWAHLGWLAVALVAASRRRRR